MYLHYSFFELDFEDFFSDFLTEMMNFFAKPRLFFVDILINKAYNSKDQRPQ